MTAFATWYIHFDIFMYVYDVILFLIGSSSMEKHPITDVATVCQWFIDRCGYRKQDKWVVPMFDVCYPFPGTHTTSALLSELYLQVGSKSSTSNMWQWYQKRDYISGSDSCNIYNTNVSSHSNLKDKALYNGNSGEKQTYILSIIYHTYLLIDWNKRDHQKPLWFSCRDKAIHLHLY